eukprot:TRINITY_DN5828_c3_g1_i1.p1 TRINITY_DN5828_c3_g1~~TRINITY_DN5828_c3_g1_i1.p1  ORF type:complete len:230 (+),score=56.49 TRINITY_DN5828_c3_g1_i1:46-690(+)
MAQPENEKPKTEVIMSDMTEEQMLGERGGSGQGMSDFRRERYVKWWMNKWARPVYWVGLGVVMGAVGVTLVSESGASRRRKEFLYVKRGEQYYQVIGHSWDQTTKDFQVLYRPLFHCKAALYKHEAHLFGTAPLSYFGGEYISYQDLDLQARSLSLPGPFTYDPEWKLGDLLPPAALPPSMCTPATVASPAESSITVSGNGTASYDMYKKATRA